MHIGDCTKKLLVIKASLKCTVNVNVIWLFSDFAQCYSLDTSIVKYSLNWIFDELFF